jgi:hypothetical protein
MNYLKWWHFLIAASSSLISASSSRRESKVDEDLSRGSVLRIGLGVGGTVIVSGSNTRPSHSCDGWVCDLGTVGVSSIFGWVRGAGAFTVSFRLLF